MHLSTVIHNTRASILHTSLALACSYNSVPATSILSFCALRPALSQATEAEISASNSFGHSWLTHARLGSSDFFSTQCCFHYAPDLSFSQIRVEFRQKRGRQFETCTPLLGHYTDGTKLGTEMVWGAREHIRV